MEEPEHLKKGVTSYRYPAYSQLVILAASVLVVGVLIQMLNAAKTIDPAVKTIGTVVFCVCYVGLMIWVFVKPKGKQKMFITSVDALRGSFYRKKIWPLVTGLYLGSFALGSAVNGFLFLAIIFVAILLMALIISRLIKNGIRIDESLNMYVLSLNKETPLRFEYASEVRCRYYSRLRKNFLNITFAPNALTELLPNQYINISKLHSEEYGTYLDPAILSDFLKEKLTSLGFRIENNQDQTIYCEWIAVK